MFICLFFSAQRVNGASNGQGYPLFKQAYNLEKSSPRKSISMYYRAMGKGLSSKYRKVCLWRLKDLHERYHEGDFEYMVTGRLQRMKWSKSHKSRRRLLREKLREKTTLSGKDLEQYIDGLRFFYTHPERAMKSWQFIIDSPPPSALLADRITDLLVKVDRKNGTSRSLDFLEKLRVSVPPALYSMQYIEILYSLERRQKTLERIFNTLQNDSEASDDDRLRLSKGQKYRLYYIAGKVSQRTGRLRRAYVYYRLAESYAYKPRRVRDLAAYCQFQLNQHYYAFELLKDGPVPEKGLSAVLYHVLNYSLNRAPASRSWLKDNRSELKRQYKKSPNDLLKEAVRYAR